MTHDELLKMVKFRLEVSELKYLQEESPSMRALLAVVELHKPMLWKNVDTDKYGYKCQACQGLTKDLYPCPTIQAIEKELG